MTDRRGTLLQMIASLDPVLPEQLGELSHSAWAEELFSEIVATDLGVPATGDAPDRVGRLRSSRRRRWAVAVSPIAASIVLALVLPAILGDPGGADPAAAAALRHLADVAANQPAQAPPGPGQYVYTESVDTKYQTYSPGGKQGSFLYGVPLTRQVWIGTDGSGRLKEAPSQITFLSAAGEAAWVAAGSPDLQYDWKPGSTSWGPGSARPLDLWNYPTDPAKLQALIASSDLEPGAPGPREDWQTFGIIGDMLRETYAPPALRAALYDIAANLPGVQFVGNTTDGAGRPGVGVAITRGNQTDELIFDPNTSQLLGETDTALTPIAADPKMGTTAMPAGSVLQDTTYLVSGVVDSTQATLSPGKIG